jgi:hypothetical protein
VITTMPNNNSFSIKQDKATIGAGGFWCSACLSGKPSSEQSPDPRYCKGCFQVLSEEARLLSGGKRPAWLPKPQTPEKAVESQYPIPQQGYRNMSTVNAEKSTVDIINPPEPKVTHGKRGPKHRELPEDLIRQWASDSMGSKAIAVRLRSEHGIEVSYKTIQRILSGQRILDIE